MILHIQQGLKEDGFTVPMTKLCRWFDVPRRTVGLPPISRTPPLGFRRQPFELYWADITDR